MRIRPRALLAAPLFLTLTLAATACSERGAEAPQGGTKAARPASDGAGCEVANPSFTEVGDASYYADSLAGNPTASGEPYDPDELTAAHRTLEFGTEVCVTNTRNGRSVLVRVNDRGPFTEGRILDVSRRAAEALDLVAAGHAPVRIDVR